MATHDHGADRGEISPNQDHRRSLLNQIVETETARCEIKPVSSRPRGTGRLSEAWQYEEEALRKLRRVMRACKDPTIQIKAAEALARAANRAKLTASKNVKAPTKKNEALQKLRALQNEQEHEGQSSEPKEHEHEQSSEQYDHS